MSNTNADDVVIHEVLTEVEFSAFPPGHQMRRWLFVSVKYRGTDDTGVKRYAVMNSMGEALGKDGEWDWEPQPSSRTKKFTNSHRFTYEEAVKRAQEACLTLIYPDGRTVAEALTEDK